MSRLQLFTVLTVVWLLLAVWQLLTGPVWLGALFAIVAVLQVVNLAHERRRAAGATP